MDSLGENEFCETNVKEGAKRTNDSLSFLFGLSVLHFLTFFYVVTSISRVGPEKTPLNQHKKIIKISILIFNENFSKDHQT
jgi:hypothetical protein